MSREAMKLALEALENSIDDVRDCLNQNLPLAGYARYDQRIEWYREQIAKHEEAITSLRQAIEQAEKNQFNPDWDAMAVMVDEQQRMAKRIEELEQAEKQEPVAWISKEDYEDFLDETKITSALVYNYEIDIPLYTTPPQPEPVIDKSAAVRIATALGWEPKRKPLTDEQIMEMYNEPRSDAEMIAFARAIEAAHGIKE